MKENLPLENWPEEHLQAATIIVEFIINNISSSREDKTCKKLLGASQNNGTFLWTRLETSGGVDDANKVFMMRQAKIATGTIGAGAVSPENFKSEIEEITLFEIKEYLASMNI